MKIYNWFSFIIIMIYSSICVSFSTSGRTVNSITTVNSNSANSHNNSGNGNNNSNKSKTNTKSKNRIKSTTATATKTMTMTSTQTEVEAYINMMHLMKNKSQINSKLKLKIGSKMRSKSSSSSSIDILNFMKVLSEKEVKPKKDYNISSYKKKFNFKSRESLESNKKASPSTINSKDKSLNDYENKGNKEPGEIFEDWWTISTKEIKSGKRYPPLLLPNGKIIEIEANKQNMRYNYAFTNCTDNKAPSTYHFYFRLTDFNIFYSSTPTDFNVLGEINWENVDDIAEYQKTFNNTKYYCIETNDKSNKNWNICTEKECIKDKWVCRIRKILKMPKLDKCQDNEDAPFNKTKILTQIQPEIIIPLPSRECNENWSYKNNGKDWECICKEGLEQSPINLPPPYTVIDSPVKPLFEYVEVGPEAEMSTLDQFVIGGQNLKMRNFNGHLTLYSDNLGKIVTLDGAVYRAEEITFHTPSNHVIMGKSFELEVSIIHYGISKGDIAKQIILSFLFEKKAGVYNHFLDSVDYFNLPNPSTRSRDIINSIYIPKILYEVNGENDGQIITMTPFSFYTYQGSLPFPPCTERTIHLVASKPLRIGSAAIQLFKEALRAPDVIEQEENSFNVIVSDLLPVSNREVKDLNGRPIFHYDHSKYCPLKPDHPIVKPVGHYEKMGREVTNYFFVSGNKPSGIPGSFVVSNEEAGKLE